MAEHVQIKTAKWDGAEMDYFCFGRGKETLVIVPGLSVQSVMGAADAVARQYASLTDAYTIYVLDRRKDLPAAYPMRDMAEDTAGALQALGLRQVNLFGASQGGMISQYLAIDHPELVEKLILAVTAPYANDVVNDAVRSWIEMAKQGDHVRLMVDTAERMYSKAYLDRNRKMFPVMARLTKPGSYERFFRNAYAIMEFDARDELSKISCPTLIVAGNDDNTVGNDAPYELNKGIPGSKVYIYHGLGHGAFEEAKDFYDRVYEFCVSE